MVISMFLERHSSGNRFFVMSSLTGSAGGSKHRANYAVSWKKKKNLRVQVTMYIYSIYVYIYSTYCMYNVYI